MPDGHNNGDVSPDLFSPDGRSVLTIGKDDQVRLWSVADGKALRWPGGQTPKVSSVRFSPDGKTLLTIGKADKTVRLWSVDKDQELPWPGGQAEVLSAQFSPDGKTVLTTGADKTARLWDWHATSRQPLAALRVHENEVSDPQFARPTARPW